MSIACMNRVWEQSKMKGSPLLLLLAFADFADDNGFCWPSIDTLAQKIRMSKRQTKRLIQRLEETEELAAVHRRNSGNVYVVLVGLTKQRFREADKRVVAFTGQSLSDKMSLSVQEQISDISTVDEQDLSTVSDTQGQISDTAMSHDPSRSVIDPLEDPSIIPSPPTQKQENQKERQVARFGKDPAEGMLLAHARKANDATSFTVPETAGGADAYKDGPLTQWCHLIGRQRANLTSAEETAWARELRRLAELRGTNAETLAWALHQWGRAIVAYALNKDNGRRVWIPGNIAWMNPTPDSLFAHRRDPLRGLSSLLAPLLEWGMEHGLTDLDLERRPDQNVAVEREEPPPRLEV